MPSAIGIVALAHAATYYGELDADGRPHGTGCVYFSAGGYYAGSFVGGRKHGPGVCGFPDGSRYEGDFVDDERDGYGVHSVPIGDRYRGQWRASAQDGVGEVLERSGRLRRGIFQSNAFEAPLEHSDDAVGHLAKATEAQQNAFIAERSARASEETAQFQASMTIDGWYIETDADLDAYEAETSARQEVASAEWLRDFRSLEAETQEGKTEEATLGETQKQLYLTIQARRKELARLSMFWDVVQDKERHLGEAKRVLDAVEREIAAEIAWANANKPCTE
ncbi:hypothetical protein SDRG_06819 [Saprolegnia diclina VS20]|uniref:MORN repeat-containing protein 5 n=1 Tax=Saprolegnia diclina (strain VS20) TaxID=1156394 RepID=T0RT05_SAPDV|nr:hypothetical protein SDRG_06819 [Saprolegnia diclina VS20]EQC35528.1 hypothetical protein SDRG_06819 [Saprolegnia diclina VS20]|eukprot:XP_008610845.1 hypothetical protein SDRG_06819 [Saprolegnia diclina VS20]